jgi:trk system potassium uptake protein TrkA
LPDDVIIGGIVRGDRVEIAVGATEIQAFDRVVVFALPSTVEKVCELFN